MDYYDQIAESYNSLHGKEQLEKLDYISQHFQVDVEDVLLDVGCGTGIALSYFDVRQAVGVDPAQKLLDKYEGDHKVICCGAEELPFDDDSFDVVVSLTAIQNFSHVRRGLEEIARVGKQTFILTWLKASSKNDSIRVLVKELFHDYKITWLEHPLDAVCIIQG
jgi:ubiquinone/menaquinone biosynthesis C-methylase UbiE